MRLSDIIRKAEDATLRQTPKAKAAALRTTHKTASYLATQLAKLAERSAPRNPEAQG